MIPTTFVSVSFLYEAAEKSEEKKKERKKKEERTQVKTMGWKTRAYQLKISISSLQNCSPNPMYHDSNFVESWPCENEPDVFERVSNETGRA